MKKVTKDRIATDSDFASPLKRTLKIGVAGCTGRMGKILCEELLSGKYPQLQLAGGTAKEERIPANETTIGMIFDRPGINNPVFSSSQDLFEISDIIIDFTAPEATAKHIWLAAKHGKPLVIGTTGLSTQQEREIHDAALECPIVYAANTSIGVNLLTALVEKAAALLGDGWDIEINETHHKLKVDAPSGTALALGKAAATGRGQSLDDLAVYAREGHTGPRKNGAIGFSVQRGGDVIGEHTVNFFGEGERLELTHKAGDRALFARGALKAARWLHDKKPGLYTMRDVLGL